MSNVAWIPNASDPMPPPGAARAATSPTAQSWSVMRQPSPRPNPPRIPSSVVGWPQRPSRLRRRWDVPGGSGAAAAGNASRSAASGRTREPYTAIDFTREFRDKGPSCRRQPVAEKIDRKQLKKPDEFQLVAGRAMGWMVDHRKLVLTAGGGILAVLLLAWGLATWRTSREAKAGAALAEALELQSRPIAGESPPQPGV